MIFNFKKRCVHTFKRIYGGRNKHALHHVKCISYSNCRRNMGVMHLKHVCASVLCSFLALQVKESYYELMLLMPHLANYFNFILMGTS